VALLWLAGKVPARALLETIGGLPRLTAESRRLPAK
jgi:hypothetical protein